MTLHHDKIIQRVSECITLANHAFPAKNRFFKQNQSCAYPIPETRFDIRGKTAGMALLQRWELRFNPILLSENVDAFIQNVVPHEISHLIVYAQCGRVRPHGEQWQKIMQDLFNVTPKTTHSFDVSSVQGRSFSYQCQCNTHHLSVRRHNKMQRQEVQYICRRCKTSLFLSTSRV